MSLNIPDSATEIIQRSKTDVQRELPTSNPFLKNSWLGALINMAGNRQFDFYLQLLEVQKQGRPDTATDTDLEEWAAIWGILRIAATAASGSIIAGGAPTTSIPINTIYKTSDGKTYTSTTTVVIAANSISVVSITRSGTTATATTTSNHNLADNISVTISGAVETDYNVTDAVITVTGLKTFTYQVANAPTTPATGAILAGFNSIPVPVISDDFGADTNQLAGTLLTLQSPIVGADDDAGADFGELGGGTDQETDAAFKLRLLDRIQNPIAHFNVAEITAIAKEIAGVTRVFIQEITPAVGQVTIHFMRDNDADPIPSAGEVTTVKNKILTIKPANTADVDVIVLAPVAVPTAFTFSSLTPNTATMQTAVTANLKQFFAERTSVGVNIDQDAYRAAIFNTIDTVTGDEVTDFTLSAPVADITIAAGEIGTLGTVTYP